VQAHRRVRVGLYEGSTLILHCHLLSVGTNFPNKQSAPMRRSE
jgi:hypothetical protein